MSDNNENKVIKAFKGFNDKLQCRDFQYEIGKTYSLEEGETVEMCERGFHAIREDVSPLNVFDYYEPSIDGKKSRYCQVEISGETQTEFDKIVGSKIKISAEIGIIGLIKSHFEWVKSRITNEYNAKPMEAASAGDYGAASAGYKGAASAGNKGAATSRGTVSVGKNGVGCVRGNGVKARGGLGSVLMVAIENENDCDIKEWKAFVVDGDTIKENTWYTIKDGNLVETE